MTLQVKPELYISNPLYESNLKAPSFNDAEFNYVAYIKDEMVVSPALTQQLGVPIHRFIQLNWDSPSRINQNIQNNQIMGNTLGDVSFSMSIDDVDSVVDASRLFIGKGIQLILQDTNPEIRLDPNRFLTNDTPIENTEIQDQFFNALKTRLDVQTDSPDKIELYQAYIDSIKEILGEDVVGSSLEQSLAYLKNQTSLLNNVNAVGESGRTTFDRNRYATKVKMSLSTRFASGLVSSAIASQGPFASELSSILPEIMRRKNTTSLGGNISPLSFSTQSEITKNELFENMTRLNPTIDNIIRTISLLFTGQTITSVNEDDTSTNDEKVLAAFNELFSNPTTISSTNQNVAEVLASLSDQLGRDLFTTLGSLVSDFVKPVGFRIDRTELRINTNTNDGTVTKLNSAPQYVLSSNIKTYRDLRVRYGSVYDYTVSAVYRVLVPTIGSSGEILRNELLICSEPSNSIRVIAEDMSDVNVVPELEIMPILNTDLRLSGIRLMWSHPADIKEKIRGFRVYRRNTNLKEPFELLREIQFRHVPITHRIFFQQEVAATRNRFPNGPLLDLTNEGQFDVVVPIRHYEDPLFLNTEQFIYCVTAIDVHGNESPCSDQITMEITDEGTYAQKMISIRGAPIHYPNLYIQRRAILDSKLSHHISRGRTKAVVFLDPIASMVKGTPYLGQTLRTGDQRYISNNEAISYLSRNLNVFNAPMQLASGRNFIGEQNGYDAFIFTSEGSVLFDGISAEYDFIVLDENTLKTAVIRTNIEYGDGAEASFWGENDEG
jgi:hypothetical protein